jgi:UDP-N-acetylmuramoyl-tripeptide--D-alanyl-D-alanine ligase
MTRAELAGRGLGLAPNSRSCEGLRMEAEAGWTLGFVRDAAGARLLRGDPGLRVAGVCTDSRQVRQGDLFVALRGPRFDGHEFVSAAVDGGAVAVLVEAGRGGEVPAGCAVLEVEDTRAALARWAVVHRAGFGGRVIAVAGSNGKTSTKELLGSVLGRGGPVVASAASFNNELGVPLTLLRLGGRHWAAVVEVGTNHPGELGRLLSWVQPDCGVFTGVGREHLEFFGDLAGVAAEEGTLAEVLPAGGVLVLSGDDTWAGAIAARTRARVVRVGFEEGNDWRAREVRLDWRGTRFRVEGPEDGWSGAYEIRLLGRHQVRNALLAVALARELGLGVEQVRAGLAGCRPAPHRMESFEAGGVRVLDDAYNANPDSMRAALETFCALPCAGRRVAVLGEMAELGAASERAHAEAGRWAAELGVQQLLAVGPWAGVMAGAAREAGLTRVLVFGEVEPVWGALRQLLRPGDALLLKASRRAGLERLAEWWRSEMGDAA